MSKTPFTLSIDGTTDRGLYDEIQKEVFLEASNKDQFLFAMAFGFKHKTREKLTQRYSFFRAEYMGPQDEALIDALAVAETGSEDVLADRARVYQIAEEYAHAGIKLLRDEVTSRQFGSFYKQFERDLFDMLKGLSD